MLFKGPVRGDLLVSSTEGFTSFLCSLVSNKLRFVKFPQGLKWFDPRSDTKVYSNNLILIVQARHSFQVYSPPPTQGKLVLLIRLNRFSLGLLEVILPGCLPLNISVKRYEHLPTTPNILPSASPPNLPNNPSNTVQKCSNSLPDTSLNSSNN